ncbi:MAG: Asp-tRNA(Asn)/Glu-tRNA(Gln) amidotransferase subunit GatB [Xanthomonadaceae bacterium]|nr:Asp-tRNA(Asn)/Glu-tRNA(Gln) amidotransferase subunit GatB [Xanthomonadaceae bacterium]
MQSEFEAVIGLEVHVQLATESKVFSRARSRPEGGRSVGEELVNMNTSPVDTAQPGTLPVLNKKVVEFAIKAGLATGCEIRPKSVFSRKHYFYPDLPKGYQISQYDLPICEHGKLEIELKNGESKTITIQRIHIEEDAGKNLHMSGYSLVNLNRAGVPLIEVVSGPDMRSSEEAVAYLKSLYAIVTYLGVCDGNLQEGNFRCDANVSVRKRGVEKFGTRAEIKNVNSFRFVEKAIDYEILRQIEVVKSGGTVIQETRGFDSAKGQTFSMRSKEEAHDYRYFPDPDLPPLILKKAQIESIRGSLPELPQAKRDRFISLYDLSKYDATVLTQDKKLSEYYEESLGGIGNSKELGKKVANLITSELARLLNDADLDITGSKVSAKQIREIAKLLSDDSVSFSMAKQIITILWTEGGDVSSVVEKHGFKQMSDTSSLEPIIDKIIAENEKNVQDYRAGKEKLIGFFVGQAMKATGGKANPGMLQDLVKKKLKG